LDYFTGFADFILRGEADGHIHLQQQSDRTPGCDGQIAGWWQLDRGKIEELTG
jgi:hypothetical protein